MKHKIRAIVAFILALGLLAVLLAMIFTSCVTRDQANEQRLNEDLLSGSELRYMMNEAKHSPGAANDYIKDHPTFAWLFDGSYVTYIETD